MQKASPKIIIAGLIIVGLVFTLFVLGGERSPISLENKQLTANNGDGEPASTDIACDGEATPSQTEGPYYKTGSPERNNIREGQSGEKLIVEGFVFNQNCEPQVNAWLDFWQAGDDGEYDLVGFNLRGYQYTDENGKYHLETVVPAAYGTRPPHIHVKVRGENGREFTSQIYFPEENLNREDSIFNEALLMNVEQTTEGKLGHFDFVIGE